jgi:hypothetical protein
MFASFTSSSYSLTPVGTSLSKYESLISASLCPSSPCFLTSIILHESILDQMWPQHIICTIFLLILAMFGWTTKVPSNISFFTKSINTSNPLIYSLQRYGPYTQLQSDDKYIIIIMNHVCYSLLEASLCGHCSSTKYPTSMLFCFTFLSLQALISFW